MSRKLRIAIDGPSGAGKSTLARALARKLRLRYVDTGAMYRAVAWRAMRASATEPDQIVRLLDDIELRIDPDPDDFRVHVDGQDVTELLRDPAVSMRASEVAQIPEVRAWLVRRQRAEAEAGAVVEGRDIGSAVLPDADAKLFVTAPEAVRMRRRAAQLGEAAKVDLATEIRERDRRDVERRTSPLRVPEGAMVIDTGAEDEARSLERILRLLDATVP